MARKHIDRTDQIFDETESVTAVFAKQQEGTQQYIPIHNLVPNRFNPRRTYSKEDLEELVHSMETYGFIGALDGRSLPDGRIELAHGSRRLLAAKTAGLKSIPVFLHDWDDDQMRMLTLIENLAHRHLTPADEADAIGYLNRELGLAVEEICSRLKKSRAWVQDRLALHSSPQDVKEMVAARHDALRSARYIARIPDKSIRLILQDKVLQQGLAPSQVQLVVQQIERGCSVNEALAAVELAEGVCPQTKPQQTQSVFPIAEAVIAAARTGELPASGVTDVSDSTPPRRESASTSTKRLRGRQWPKEQAPQSQESRYAHLPDEFHSKGVPDGQAGLPLQTDSAEELSGSGQLLNLAVDALSTFDPQAVRTEETSRILDLLKRIRNQADTLKDKLTERLT